MSDHKVESFTSLVESIVFDEQGLVPAIVQDDQTNAVLMLAYMNKQSLALTLEKKETWFWSRSKQKLWNKGETSGNKQTVTSIHYDCDGDALLVRVKPKGPACHTGETTCFYTPMLQDATSTVTEKETNTNTVLNILHDLEQTIKQREVERPEGAYTTYLFEQGLDKILKKVGEEAAEVIIAAKNRDKEELTYETSDLLFHLLVLLREQELPFYDVLEELHSRHTKQ
ncbi:bifunctional phosphoribosyl-AMP cyclohydrolase/phosphoribosyl-ATP diphosphatase HisIE [Longirhabdus pacifica]|uniref:bifunctional phosphoribosyl-AMP cyclohydrolase/phosphoribosyl-ATP diphosphatase HisIE n=1 Tax=Longirhabdus pacifica TaxID=2305227 RepID=UPI001008893E|nr:bifunctional phosphoribosyl-AMP cyclohydrolase/phosphoribosyl-ATP diphosphatase HisIE [Longirhabdus pacifica]